jgi:hypothetical protein
MVNGLYRCLKIISPSATCCSLNPAFHIHCLGLDIFNRYSYRLTGYFIDDIVNATRLLRLWWQPLPGLWRRQLALRVKESAPKSV